MFLFCLFLLAEFLYLKKARQKLAWCVAVGGVRGKSSVTRLIAAALREAGIKTFARTTGSKPVIIFPDGQEEEINRTGLPSILEGKKVLNLARKAKAQALVVELMAINPECLETEVRKIFKPQLLILTNFRPDHLEELGRSREEVARNLLRSVSRDTTVLLLEEEITPEIKEYLEKKGVPLIVASDEVKIGQSGPGRLSEGENLAPQDWRRNFGDDFPQNIRLALAAIRYLGLNEATAISGMRKVKPDFGSLKIWEYALPGKSCGYLVSAFAANEPESSAMVVRKIKELIPWGKKKIYALLLFRRDRGDRTAQWLQAIRSGFFAGFDGLFLCGCPSFSLFLTLRKVKGRNLSWLFSLKKFRGHFSRYEDFSEPGKISLEKRNPGERRESFEGGKFRFERSENWVDHGEDFQGKEKYGNENRLNKAGEIIFPEIKKVSPEKVMGLAEELSQKEEREWILIGLGNIVGLGAQLLDLWEKKGRRIHG